MKINRKETTELLGKLVREYFYQNHNHGGRLAKEVIFNYGAKDIFRVDYLGFSPERATSISGIERGKFICFEVKSCKEDFNSGFGRNFYFDENWLVVTMDTWKEINNLIDQKVGVLVAIPKGVKPCDYFFNENKKISAETVDEFSLKEVIGQNPHIHREKSITECLYAMLGKSI